MSNGVAPIQEIEQFLTQIKREVVKAHWFHFMHRSKNVTCLTNLGLNVEAARNEILSLTYRDYDRGPLPNDAGSGHIWEFIREIDGTSVYIKLKLDPPRGCVCLSFHESSGPVSLPYGCGV